MGRAYISGTLVYAFSSGTTEPGSSLEREIDFRGPSRGLGVDFSVAEDFVAGVVYTQRTLSNWQCSHKDMDTVEVRLAYSF